MNAQEQRAELIDVARKLTDEIRQVNLIVQDEMRRMTAKVHKVVGALLTEADVLLPQAAAEHEAGEPKVTKVVRYDAAEKLPALPHAQDAAPKLAAGKRACSLCRRPGHRATSCPNAHTVRAADKARKEKRK